MKLRDIDLNYAFLSMRVALGMTFFLIGFNKIINYGVIVPKLQSGFTETWLPDIMVSAYVHALPFAELILGLLVAVGLFTRPAMYLTGILMITLNFGLLVKGDSAGAKKNIVYILLIGLDIILLNYNKYSLDQLLFGSLSDD